MIYNNFSLGEGYRCTFRVFNAYPPIVFIPLIAGEKEKANSVEGRMVFMPIWLRI